MSVSEPQILHPAKMDGHARNPPAVAESESRFSLADLPRRFMTFDEKVAVIAMRKSGAEMWSYRTLGESVLGLARSLTAIGVRNGVAAVIFGRNSPEWIVACLSIIQAGGIVVPVDAQIGNDDLQRVLTDSDCRIIFTTTDEFARLDSMEAARRSRIILLDAAEDDARSWRAFDGGAAPYTCEWNANRVVALFYTSGTSGSTKGVPLTNANLGSQVDAVVQTGILAPTERLLLPLPLHHVYPFSIGMLLPLALGLPIILPHSLTGPDIARALGEERATAIVGVPRFYDSLFSGLEAQVRARSRVGGWLFAVSLAICRWLRQRFGIRAGRWIFRGIHRAVGPDLRILACGGAALDLELGWKLQALGWDLAIGYGLTETSPLLTLDPPGAAHLGTAGRPIAGVELRIMSGGNGHEPHDKEEVRKDAARGISTGEIQARGPGVFSGYRNLPDRTAQAFTTDGWFRTGDIGFLDDRSYLHIVGRVSSMIVTPGGEKVQPDDLEKTYQKHPAIREIGILQSGDKLVAVVVVPPGSPLSPPAAVAREAIETISRDLPTYQRISDFVLSEEPLARTRLGKIRRHLLSSQYELLRAGTSGFPRAGPVSFEEMSDEDAALLEHAVARRVWNVLIERYPQKRLTPSSNPRLDLGIDSMEWLDLSLQIQTQAGIELEEAAIGRIQTVRDLLREAIEAHAARLQGPAPWLEKPDSVLTQDQQRCLRPHGFWMQGVQRALYFLARLLFQTFFSLRVNGRDRLPTEMPFVLVPNHVSFLDAPVLAAALNAAQLCDTYWAGWTGVMTRNMILRGVGRIAHVIPIDAKHTIVSSLAFGAAVLKRGKSLIWFAEGTISRTGALQAFKPGLGILLAHYPRIVVPVWIDGTARALPPGTFRPRLGQITISFGAPISIVDLPPAPNQERPAQILGVLQRTLSDLATQSRSL